MIEIKEVRPNSKEMQDFLALPKTLYQPTFLTQSETEEKAQLLGEHELSSYYQLEALVAYKEGRPTARLAIIGYPKENKAYIGYFEAQNDWQTVRKLFETVKAKVRAQGKTHLVGPVNASFWLGYRMKLDHFDQPPFTGEPTGLAFYPKLWQRAGFQLSETYGSVFYRRVPLDDHQGRLEKRYHQFLSKGYTILSPKPNDWTRVSAQVFRLLSTLYADFPLYHAISEDSFKELFAPYRYILDFSMVKLAYKDDQLVGFLITLPDYGNLVYQKKHPINLLKLLKIRKKAKRYLILYLGVAPDHLGLGSALTYPIYQEIKARKALAVGALIHQGKITEHYAPTLKADNHHYGLFEMIL
ncbi:hypothetical protein [Streptococcus moroccensis]|uniref:N-acetyltransferase domain-containing protein n=1 Tax=Streptococcus moroccensis TaxID=1451356 RepID=A0ABT9YTD6_9STRE|nr:hypothetical protein [Streptococcus moroccensis]MDQ0222395.1 hypothetical protein [Streptococcus moroccensis]